MAVVVPAADCTRLVMIGMLLPTLISASSLSEVRMFGAEMMLMPLSVATAGCTPWISAPIARHRIAGRVDSRIGDRDRAAEERRREATRRGRRRWRDRSPRRSPSSVSVQLPIAESCCRPLIAMVDDPAEAEVAGRRVTSTSMISASTITWGRAMSSARSPRRGSRSASGLAWMISELVGASAVTRTPSPSSATALARRLLRRRAQRRARRVGSSPGP